MLSRGKDAIIERRMNFSFSETLLITYHCKLTIYLCIYTHMYVLDAFGERIVPIRQK